MEKLTEKQKMILDYIKEQVKINGVVPSVREICVASGLSSTSSVHSHLATLEKKGYIKRKQAKTRNIKILEENFYNDDINAELSNIPILGKVSAGMPILAEENIEDYFPVPVSYLKNNDAFMLRIAGDSMINAGILDGDLVLVNKQQSANSRDIVIALINDEATCKRFIKEGNMVFLKAENSAYPPIVSNELVIIGKVIGLFRSF